MIKTIGLVTGGGDAPGLNAVIRAVVKTAVGEFGLRVVGIEDSYEGLLGETHVRELRPADVRGLLPRGGTILGTRNRGSFVLKNLEDPGGESVFREAIANLERLEVDALVAVGGEGTLGIALEFSKRGFPVVGVPKTIDNDLAATELTFGFMTALDIASEALDRLHTTAESHDRAMVLEVMGRHAGWIALHSGISGGADVILIPEIPFAMEKVAQKVRERDSCGALFSIIVAAEGAREAEGSQHYLDMGDRHSAPRLGGVGHHVAHELTELTGKETRCVVLGHLQRGGSPNAFDRMLATNFGSSAVRALARGKTGVMVALHASNIRTVPLSAAVTDLKTVPLESQLIRCARDVGISFGATDEDETHGHEC
ncbi:MAG TPA: ATP-dependent 6-phosphofructokinase [Pyrinomonadaceae bacterium]|jgi:6-phosphofructokinase 1|nr:ATP-dependent 6-phosphofructokinase [Pyrinomonadaceae bacterium]